MISHEQATAIAVADASRYRLGVGVQDVLRLEDIQGRRPMVYPEDLANCWIAYIETGAPPTLRSRTIVAIDGESGRVVYRGSAHDRG
jgi:hypothetical protein